MLTPTQVIPFLTHDDRLVRQQALQYFRDCPNPAPLVADDYWAVLDQIGGEGDGGIDDEALHIAGQMAGTPQTETSLRRLVDAVAARPPGGYAGHYQRAIRDVGFPLLVEHRDLLLGGATLDEDVAAHLRRRLALADVPVETVWDRLMQLGRDASGSHDGEVDWDEADALVEAAARHIDVVAAPAIATLSDVEAAEDWREVFAVMVLGEGRHAPATPDLIDLLDLDEDVLREEVVRALAKIGTAEVADRLATFIPGRRWDVRLYADDVLGNIKRPESEAALLRLLPLEPDDGLRGDLLYELCALGSLAGLDVARTHVAADPKHPETIGLYEALLGTAAMNGVALPEEPRWRKLIADHKVTVAARMAKLDKGGLKAFVDLLRDRKAGLGGPEPEPLPPRPLPGDYDPYAPIKPIRNEAPKVGRNDPCPCGSGKKHKKCCGAAK
jgi:hypothetical protein